MDAPLQETNRPAESLRQQVRSAILWRSGTQIVGQLIAWASTFLVIRILSPQDYGLFAMTQVVLVVLNMLNGYGLASALIQKPEVDDRAIRQLFGMLLVLNGALAILQIAAAPLAATYFRHPQVAELLRVQALLYLATPFIAFPYALLSRAMDFRRQAAVNLLSAVLGALAALGGALGGLGVWTLVLAPMVLFGTRAVGMMVAARAWVRPSFDFRGAGGIARYGVLMATSQLFWVIQSQADVFVAGRHLDAHALGIYTTSLFLAQILVAKFVPPINDVAFSAYARIQHDRSSVAAAFLMGVRMVLLLAMPFYLGLAVVAEPLVSVVLGEKWLETGPIVGLLALAMPFLTLQILFAPACDACGRPGISAGNGAIGAILLPVAFLVGVRHGVLGLATAWLVTAPLYLALCAWRTLPVIGVRAGALASAVSQPLLGSVGMALAVLLVDQLLPPLAPLPRVAILVPAGALVYAGWMLTFGRGLLAEALALVRSRRA